jgi:UDP-2-acetamido-3-amino-2,3-dideoxy-glucuronate N-acetyltransferase
LENYFVHSSAVIDPDCTIGHGTKIWHFSHLMTGCVIGINCTIGQNVFIMPGVILGEGVKVQNNVSLYTGVICENDVFLGPSCVFTNVINPRSAIDRKKEFSQTLVCHGATIGANATIICGIRIGKFAFVGAGAVVAKDVEDYALIFGNPARQRGWVSEAGAALDFKTGNLATCKITGEKYTLHRNIVAKKQAFGDI